MTTTARSVTLSDQSDKFPSQLRRQRLFRRMRSSILLIRVNSMMLTVHRMVDASQRNNSTTLTTHLDASDLLFRFLAMSVTKRTFAASTVVGSPPFEGIELRDELDLEVKRCLLDFSRKHNIAHPTMLVSDMSPMLIAILLTQPPSGSLTHVEGTT